MRIALKELLEKFGVRHVLSPYETQPWFFYDEAKGQTCSAEVRMGPGAADLEAEIQLLKDEDIDESSAGFGGREQIMIMRIKPTLQGLWAPESLFVKGKEYTNEIHDWEGKGCSFFRACIQAMQMNQMPDFDELIKREFPDDDWGGGGSRGKIGRKAPKIKPAQLLGMKRPM